MRSSFVAGALALSLFSIPPLEAEASSASLRLEVKPSEAFVYVDGFLAGNVEEFDGFFQRLHLEPGSHELVVYLDGYRTLRESLYVSSGKSYKLRRALEALSSGETSEPPPEPPVSPSPAAPGPTSEFGVLELTVQPEEAEILIDGDVWPSRGEGATVAIHLPPGEHRVEIRRPGRPGFASTVQLEAGKTTALNVKLP